METIHFVFAYAIITLLSCILCTSSFVAGILAKSIRSRPDAEEIIDRGSLRTILAISQTTFYITTGTSGFLLLVGIGLSAFWALGLFP